MTETMQQPARATGAADPDAADVLRARSGDYAAFESLVSRYEQRVFALAMRFVRHRADAEEVVQETFVSLVEHLDSFTGEGAFVSWLLRIAANHSLQVLRKRRRRGTKSPAPTDAELDDSPLPHPQFIAPWQSDPQQLALDHETQRLIHAALDSLDEKYRLVFVLRDIEGLSTEQTARALAISPANVKVRLLRARLMLRERLTREFGDPDRQLPHGH